MNELMNVYWLRRNHEIVLVPQCHKYLSTIKRLLTLTNNYGRKCAFVMSFSSFSSFSRLFSSQISLHHLNTNSENINNIQGSPENMQLI